MKKVVHLGYLHRFDDGRIVYKECKSIKDELGVDIIYITSNRNGETTENEIEGVKIRTIKVKNRKIRRLFCYAKDILEEVKSIKPDVCHIHEFVLFFIIGKLRREGIKVILDMHENDLEDETEKFTIRYGKTFGKIIHYLLQIYEKNAVKKANAVISVTPQIIERIQTYGKPVEMITNYPFRLHEDAADNNMDLSNRLKTVCFAGGVSDIWGIKTILDAIEKEDDIHFILAGPATESYIQSLTKKLAWERTDYLGVISHAKVAEKVYSKSGIGMALLSDKTGWIGNEGTLGNTKLFEFMQHGLPVICTNYSLWEEIIIENNCGLSVDPFNTVKILEAIKWLGQHPEEAKKMGDNGKRLIQETYNWENEVPKLISVYKGVDNQCQ